MIVNETYIDVRYYETDLMGIVHHSNYVRYFECGRIAMPIEKIEESVIMLPVVSVECKYKLPTRMGDRLKVVSKVDKLPLAKMVISNEIYNQDGELACCGSVVIGFIHSDTRRPTRAPEILLEKARRYFE